MEKQELSKTGSPSLSNKRYHVHIVDDDGNHDIYGVVRVDLLKPDYKVIMLETPTHTMAFTDWTHYSVRTYFIEG